MRKFASIFAAIGLLLITVGTVTATKPNPEHKVTICHATPPDTAANGWHQITVDVASSGYKNSGHQDQHDMDIIPPYSYGDFQYGGKNWTTEGQAIWLNGCVIPKATPEVTPEPTPEITPEPTPVVTPDPTPITTPEVTPVPTLPDTCVTNPLDIQCYPTDTVSETTNVVPMLLIVLGATITFLSILKYRSIKR